jgi:hypothetical protein
MASVVASPLVLILVSGSWTAPSILDSVRQYLAEGAQEVANSPRVDTQHFISPRFPFPRKRVERAAVNVQCVAVKGLRRKVPNASRYLFPRRQISLAEFLHNSKACCAGSLSCTSLSDVEAPLPGKNGFANRITQV